MKKLVAKLASSLIGLACVVLATNGACAKPTFVFSNCRATQAVGSTPAVVPPAGAITRGFIKCFGELLNALDALALDANSDRLQVFESMIKVYRQLVNDVMITLEEAPGTADAALVRDFEITQIIGSRIIDEMVAYEPMANAPDPVVPAPEKQDKGEKIADSLKKLIMKYADALIAILVKKVPENPFLTPEQLKAQLEVQFESLDEILTVLRGK